MDKKSIEFNGLIGGLFIFIGLLIFFFIMSLLGLVHNLELRALNLFIMAGGVYFSIKNIKRRNKDFDYLKGMGTGFLAAISSSLAFALFNILFLTVVNPDFMTEVIAEEPFGSYLTPFTVAIVILMEGVASGFLFTFGIMQWFKRREGNRKAVYKQEDSSERK
ncbi:hypothetical protein GCM10011506_39490 [Marivirga lumbricoides]|uniref:DUF4199 domain-containing protein n=1 Tax=Marivirga lumbricoides TaxID=1046115 RepID=A0A2T4DR50_9BACT|nr:hypothetical protein C9994_07965 [Marivirga lumbricoides]GGC49978.1 hypothetical protein GCM10011506_39490 [Marivirga lumbricoides]